MKLRNNYFFTLRDDVKDEESTSGNLLVRSGMIKKTSNGIYMFLPLGLKVIKNIENIIREEMNKKDALELSMPSLIPSEIYEKSGRMEAFGDDVFSLKDRYNRNYILGPTHEELFTIASSFKIKSYKDMPYTLYQFQNKFRDEPRPRFGLIRVREFIMKDAYSFDKDLEGLDVSYQKMYEAYKNAFDRMNLNYKVVKADTGVMGGLLSEEFQAITDIGEDILVLCDKCDFSSNLEVAPCVHEHQEVDNEVKNLEEVYTPNMKTIEDVCNYLNVDIKKTVKALMFNVDGNLCFCFVRGDREVNTVKLSKLIGAKSIELATDEEIKNNSNAVPGFTGVVDLKVNDKVKIIFDESITNLKNIVVGANKKDYHYINVDMSKYQCDYKGDISNVREGDLCPRCGGKLHFTKGIEIGNIFKLGTKYSESLNLTYLDQNNKPNPVVMGSYGIGVPRCMAAIVEQNNDDKGIIWPYSVAPYKVCIVIANTKDEIQNNLANEIYQNLLNNNIEVLLDDRNERLGVKLNDMDLIGVPIRILVGKKATENIVEFKLRDKTEIEEISSTKIVDKIININKQK